MLKRTRGSPTRARTAQGGALRCGGELDKTREAGLGEFGAEARCVLGREQRVAGSRRRQRRASRECAEAARSSRWLGAERRKELRTEHVGSSRTPVSLQGWARRRGRSCDGRSSPELSAGLSTLARSCGDEEGRGQRGPRAVVAGRTLAGVEEETGRSWSPAEMGREIWVRK